MSEKGRTKAALKIALYASTFGGIFSALTLLFLAPQVAKVAANIGTAEYFLVCVFGLTIIAGISGKSMIKGISQPAWAYLSPASALTLRQAMTGLPSEFPDFISDLIWRSASSVSLP